MALIIREATLDDVTVMHDLTFKLALYEKKRPEEILVTPDKLAKWGFGPDKVFDTVLAEVDNMPVGMAVYFYTYAGSVGNPILYIEDLFVLFEHRDRGIGKALLKWLARRALKKECCRMQWAVFDWNAPAIHFYQSIGAAIRSDLPQVRMNSPTLLAFTQSGGDED